MERAEYRFYRGAKIGAGKALTTHAIGATPASRKCFVATRSIATGGPERLDFVLAERQRRPLGTADVLAIDDTTLGTPLHRVHSARNLDFLQGA